jgi:hypothetical protein
MVNKISVISKNIGLPCQTIALIMSYLYFRTPISTVTFNSIM